MRREGLLDVAAWCRSSLWIIAVISSACSQPVATSYHCPFLAKDPSLDGNIEGDAAWNGVPWGEEYRDLREGVPSEKQTRFCAGFTRSGLYIGVVCDESKLEEMVCEMSDGDPIWDEDSVEIFLSPDGKKELQFAVNPMGSRASPVTLQRWRAETSFTDTAWSIEMLFPWEVLGQVPLPGDAWGLNVCRNILGTGDMEHSTWAPVEDTFHDVANFGDLTFQSLGEDIRQDILSNIEDVPALEAFWIYSKPKLGVQSKDLAGRGRVVYNQGNHVSPKISPDGQRILFNSMEGGSPGIWIVGRNGEGKERLCSGRQGAWCSDGEGILFVREGDVWRRHLITGDEEMVARSDDGPLDYPCPAGNDDLICRTGDGRSILLFREGGKDLQILAKGEIGIAPRLSPDGCSLAYQQGAHIVLLNMEDGSSRQLTTSPGIQCCPSWDSLGKGLCYLQGEEPFVETWTLYHVGMKGPSVPDQIEKDLHLNFDWIGSWGIEGTEPINGIGFAAGMEPLHVENDWLSLSMSKNEIHLCPGLEKDQSKPIVLRFISLRDSSLLKLKGVEIVERDDGGVALAFRTDHVSSTPVMMRIFRTSPAIEIRPEDSDVGISLRIDMASVVVPDRFGNDIVLEKGKDKGKSLCLPEEPMTLTCFGHGRGMACVVTPHTNQKVDLSLPGGDMSICPRGQAVHVALLWGDRLWEWKESQPDEAGRLAVTWKSPFPGLWRMTLFGEDLSHSRMWRHEDLVALQGRPLPSPEACEMVHPRALLYVYGRVRATPLNVWTPEDVLLEILGARGYTEVCRLKDLRGCRSGEQPVPFPELGTRKVGWAPWEVHLEKRGFGVLDIMAGLYAAGTPGSVTFAQSMGEDAVTIIAGMDLRVGEYEAYLGHYLENLPRGERWQQVTDAFQSVMERGRKTSFQNLAALDDSLRQLVDVVEGREGHIASEDILYRKEEFKTFSRKCRDCLEERQELLEAYRATVVELREYAGRRLLVVPDAEREDWQAFRHSTTKILAGRHYLEGHWRGEVPLHTPAWDPLERKEEEH